MRIHTLLLSGIIVSGLSVGAQSLQPTVIASDGGYSVVAGGSLSWTIGEPISETYSVVGNFLTQGFQQPSIMLVGTNDPTLMPDLFIYPNPATEQLYIDPSDLPSGTFSVSVYDLMGKQLSKFEFIKSIGINTPWSLSLLDLSNGMYMIRISSSAFEHSTRFIKTK